MKKILCFTLALLLCLSSVCTAYASSTDSDHGGTGGSLGDNHGGTGGSIDWDKLQPCDDELINKAKETLNYMIFPDKAGVAAELLSLLGSNDLDDDTKKYMDDNLKDNVKTDGTYFYYSPTYIQNINHKVQNRVHALNGTASVSVAYSLKSGENAAHLVAYYLAEDGSFEKLPVIYDAATGKATFKTTHFSTFVITHEYSSDFSDVNLRKWFYNEVNTALENGWFKGLTATRFGPDDGMTRAMLVQVLYRMSGSKAASTAQFTDVADGKWYAEAIAWASENGIVNGFTDGRFQPDTLITRQQLAAILYRYDTYRGHTPQGSAALDGYADAASVESWAAEAMSWANGNSLVTGVTPTTLVPNGTATRAQVAVILSRYTDQ